MPNEKTRAMGRVQRFVDEMPNVRRADAEDAIRCLRKRGSSWEYIDAALALKKREEWERYGFGLLFKDSYRAQVQKELQKRKEEEPSGSLWVEDEETREEEPQNEEGRYSLILGRYAVKDNWTDGAWWRTQEGCPEPYALKPRIVTHEQVERIRQAALRPRRTRTRNRECIPLD